LAATDPAGQTERAKRAIRELDLSDKIRPYDLARVDPDVQSARLNAKEGLIEIIYAMGDAVSTYIVVRDEWYKTFQDVEHRVARESTMAGDTPENL
jgi:hypothetical protein